MTTAKLQVFDPPMCCSSGVCGPNADPKLAQFASDLEWLRKQGVVVERFNLSSNPAAFAQTQTVNDALRSEGKDCLPLLVLDNKVVHKGGYPERDTLAELCGIGKDSAQTPGVVPSKSDEKTSKKCGPGCNCGTSSGEGKGKAKGLICLIVLAAIVCILIYKTFPRQTDSANNTAQADTGFVVTPVVEKETLKNMVRGQDANGQKKTEEKPAPTATTTVSNNLAQTDKRIGEYIESFKDLNKVALNQDAVFIFIPTKESASASDQTKSAVLSVQKTLSAQNIKIGLYTLKNSSPDVANISAQVQLPAIIVACKGKGMGAVSGDVTETKLLQTFVASSQAGGCGAGSSGCGPASAGCK